MKNKMKYDKLIRDKIPEIITNKGGEPIIHIAEDKEYWAKLKEKLTEETKEFLKGENEEELADILEVLRAICDFKEIDWEDLEILRQKKVKKRGGFKNRIILEES